MMVSRLTVLRLRRLSLPALVVSLAANLFFGGLWLAGWEGANRHPVEPAGFLEQAAGRLPPNDMAVVRQAILEKKRLSAADRERRKEFRQRLREALQGDPFDLAAVVRLLEENDRASADYRRRMREGLLNAAASVSAETRRQLSVMDAERERFER
jgi:uncharacterized membrane protein